MKFWSNSNTFIPDNAFELSCAQWRPLYLCLKVLKQHHFLSVYYKFFYNFSACGSGLVYLAGMAALSMHFDKHLITALSLATAGIGIGIFIFPILIQTTMRCYDWKGTLVIVGGMLLNLVACGMTFPNNTRKGWRDIPKLQPKAKPKVKSKPDRTTSDVDNMEHTLAPRTDIAEPKQRFLIAKMFTNHHYVLLCVNSLCAIFGQSVVYTHLVAYSQSLGISEYKSALLISTIGVCNIIGRLLFVIVERLTKWNALIFHIFSYITAGIFIILIPLSDNYIWLHFCGGIFGAMSSTLGNMVPAIIVDFLGPSLMANGFGNLMLFEAVGQTLGGPLASKILLSPYVMPSRHGPNAHHITGPIWEWNQYLPSRFKLLAFASWKYDRKLYLYAVQTWLHIACVMAI